MTTLFLRPLLWLAVLDLAIAPCVRAETASAPAPAAAFQIKGFSFAAPVVRVTQDLKTATADYTAAKDGRIAVFQLTPVGPGQPKRPDKLADARLRLFGADGAPIKARMHVVHFGQGSGTMKRPALEPAAQVRQNAKGQFVPELIGLAIIAPVDATAQRVVVKAGSRVLFTATLP